MRMHIELDDQLVTRIDELSGPRGRSAFVRSAIESAIRQEFRWADIEAAAGAIANRDHDWDHDPAAWVRQQRHADVRRAGRPVLRVLDSTVLIDFLCGHPAVERVMALRASGDVPATTAINVEEIVRGLRASETEAARRLFTGLIVLPVDTRAAWQAGTWRRLFAARGMTLYQSDCLVAATARMNYGALATGNPKDFPMRELRVEHWPIGT